MTGETVVAVLLALAVLAGWARIVWWHRRAPVRSAPWRIAALLALQPVAAVLLYLTLLPPRMPMGAARLVVATAGAPPVVAIAPGERLVALPEAGTVAGAERVPDLGSAVRDHGAVAIRVVGSGLTARDRDAARDVAVTFALGDAPRGLIGLYPPATVSAGGAFRVGVRVAGLGAAAVELRDPAGRVVDRVVPAADGIATLGGTVRAAGVALFAVRVRRGDATVAQAAVPVVVEPVTATRLLIVAGAPGPEVKYLRRWAGDAGLSPLVRAPLGGGVAIGGTPLTPTVLARIDAAIVDERGWASLSAGERRAMAAAVRGGMGVVFRVTGALPAAVRAEWRAMGLDLAGGEASASVALAPAGPGEAALQARRGPGTADVPVAIAGARGELPALTRRIVTMRDATPALTDARGAVLAAWRASGRGRVAAWTVDDSFALVTAGHGDRHGEWWSDLISTVARPDRRPGWRTDPLPRAGERMAVCGLPQGGGTVDGGVRLLPDPAAAGCAGYWPRAAGWHRIADARGATRAVYVYPADALAEVRAEERRAATAALVGIAGTGETAHAGERGSPWPWFAGWLATVGLLWWLERSRAGRGVRVPAAPRHAGTDPA